MPVSGVVQVYWSALVPPTRRPPSCVIDTVAAAVWLPRTSRRTLPVSRSVRVLEASDAIGRASLWVGPDSPQPEPAGGSEVACADATSIAPALAVRSANR